ncbi:MAG TPA: SUMF1/EgtB/PvdO family nonheme iron enzyme [Thermoanaerobaculia bacterium]|nr:SUMF1/EgtB/PvdO family nonheme iron enzyme [Thermoanaerobaculia bacterium]
MPLSWPRSDDKGLSRFVNEYSDWITHFDIGVRPLALRPDALSIAELIYNALIEAQLQYEAGFSLVPEQQEIRTHSEVLSSKRGNCLDLSLLFGAIAISRQLVPIVVVFDDHAMVMLDRRLRDEQTRFRRQESRIFENGIVTNVAELAKLIERDAYAAIECTGFAALEAAGDDAPEWRGRENGVLPFARAREAGANQLTAPPPGRSMRFAIDVLRLRAKGYGPSAENSRAAASKTSPEERTRFAEQIERWLASLNFAKTAPSPLDGLYSRPPRDILDDRLEVVLKIENEQVVPKSRLLEWIYQSKQRRLAVVSRRGYEETALELTGENARLLTAPDIEPGEKLLPLLRNTIADYEGKSSGASPLGAVLPADFALGKEYVRRRAFRRVDPDKQRDNVNVTVSILRQPGRDSHAAIDYPSVEQFVDLSWLPDSEAQLLVVAGEAGAGKTAVLAHLVYELSRRYIERNDPNARLPLFFPLRDYDGESDILPFMNSVLNDYRVAIDGPMLLELLRRGRLLLFMDGFDEIPGGIGSRQAVSTYLRLKRLRGPGTKMIISSRRGFFVDAHNRAQTNSPLAGGDPQSREEDKHLSILELRPYDRDEIVEVAKARRPRDWERFVAAYDRKEISEEVVRWPDQLSFVLEDWTPEMRISKSSRGDTFHTIAQNRRRADEQRQPGLWPLDVKQKFLERLARRIGTAVGERSLSLPQEQVDDEIRASFHAGDDCLQRMPTLRTQIVDSYYLASGRYGEVQFTTRPWLDYHHAQFILRHASTASAFEELLVPPAVDSEVPYFVKSGIRHFEGLEERIAAMIPNFPEPAQVETWLFWREMLPPARLQPQFEAEDAIRKTQQAELHQLHDATLQHLAEHGLVAAVVPGTTFVRGGWEVLPAHVLPDLVRPPRLITVSKTTLLGVCLVTNAEFARFIEETGYQSDVETSQKGHVIGEGDEWIPRSGVSWRDPRATGQDAVRSRPKHPVVQVSRNDALAYCEWLSEKVGMKVRLPTEAVWELAARGRLGRLYPWGNDWRESQANGATLHVQADIDADEPYERFWREEPPLPHTTEVGQFPPNALGIYDLAGNAWEWTLDWYRGDYYVTGPDRDPANEDERGAVYQIIRGGGWDDQPQSLKCYWRYPPRAGQSGDNLGFRIAITLREEQEVT